MRNWIRGAGILALVLCTSAGCIDESDSKNPGASYQDGSVPVANNKKTAEPTKVTATLAEWTIGLSKTTIPTGTISFVITNNGTEDHAFEVSGANQEWKTDPIKPGATATLSIALDPGSYDVYCPLASGGEAHADRGMKVTISVGTVQ